MDKGMHTYLIRYRDAMSKGEWRETTHTGRDEKTRDWLIGFFGLDGPDVMEYEITKIK